MFRKGENVKCVYRENHLGWLYHTITIDKHYEICEVSRDYIVIYDDRMNYISVPKNCFISLSFIRNEVIDDILS